MGRLAFVVSTLVATVGAVCNVPMVRDHQVGTPTCVATYPRTLSTAGGEKIMMALSNFYVPWYSKASFDPCPYDFRTWRQRPDGAVRFQDPILPPKIVWVPGPALTLFPVSMKVINRTLDVVDFRKFTHMSDQRNAELIELHKNDVLVEWEFPATQGAGAFWPIVTHNGLETPLTECTIYLYEAPMKLADVFPEKMPAQGGTTITVMGLFLGTYRDKPAAKFVAPSGEGIVVPVHTRTDYSLEFDSPPILLNETDVTVNITLYLSFSGQTWYPMVLNGNESIPLVYYDHSRIVCNQVITLESGLGLNPGAPHKVLALSPEMYQTGARNHQAVTAIDKPLRDQSIFWIVKEKHGAPPCMMGMPMMCGSTIRLTNAASGRNLRAGWKDAPSKKTREVTADGEHGFGDLADNWIVHCEKNTLHNYHTSLYDKNLGQADTGESIIQNFTWDALPYDTTLHQRKLKYVLEENDKWWRPSTMISLQHEGTQRYLSIQNETLPDTLCNRNLATTVPEHCPVETPFLVYTIPKGKSGDRLRNSIRMYTSSVLDVPLDCGTTTDNSMRIRWKRWYRPLRVGDFVVWQNNGRRGVCVNQGMLHESLHCERCNYITGRINRILPDANVLEVEVWELRYPLNNNFLPSETPQFTQTLQRRNTTLLKHEAYGPIVYKLDGNSRGPVPPPPPPPPENPAEVDAEVETTGWVLDPLTGQWVPPQIIDGQIVEAVITEDDDDTPVNTWSNSRRNTMDVLSSYFVTFRLYAKLQVELFVQGAAAYQELGMGQDP